MNRPVSGAGPPPALARAPFRVAAPSWVLPGTVAENCAWLRTRFPEVGLCLFEARACLDYGEDDLPPALAELPLAWHAHLPMDLPWTEGQGAVWAIIEALLDKVAFLAPWAYVLHPPSPDAGGAQALLGLGARFAAAGVEPDCVLLENVRGAALADVWDVAVAEGFSACLDLGHILAHGQQGDLDLPGLRERVRMLHAYAPGGLRAGEARHAPLTRLDAAGRELLERLLGLLGPGGTLLLENFDANDATESLEYLTDFMDQRTARK